MAEEQDRKDGAQDAATQPASDGAGQAAQKAAPQAPASEAKRPARSADDSAAEEAAPARGGRRAARVPPVGIAHVKATFNNTIVSISDLRGNVISWSSAGKAGFKGSRKSTAFAATVVGQDAARAASAKGMHEVEIQMQGAGSGRESAVRAIQSAGLAISSIKDITPIPHNGCRQRKRRRV